MTVGRGGQVETVGDVVVLGESRFWPAVAVPIALTGAIVAVGALMDAAITYPLIFAGGALLMAVVLRGRAILADDEGLLIRRGGTLRRSYAWSEVERAGWVSSGFWGTALTVNPRGGPYDVPGPNSATNILTIWRPRHDPDDPLPALLRRHGVKSLTDA